jgi:hypothetical protein
MYNFNEEVCDYDSTQVTENFGSCQYGNTISTSICPSGCALFWGVLYTCIP